MRNTLTVHSLVAFSITSIFPFSKTEMSQPRKKKGHTECFETLEQNPCAQLPFSSHWTYLWSSIYHFAYCAPILSAIPGYFQNKSTHIYERGLSIPPTPQKKNFSQYENYMGRLSSPVQPVGRWKKIIAPTLVMVCLFCTLLTHYSYTLYCKYPHIIRRFKNSLSA